MGVDAADYDRSGYPSVMITNFSNQMLALYHNERNGLFVDDAPHSDVGHATLLTLGFGCFFFDYDLDGWLETTSSAGAAFASPRVARGAAYADIFNNGALDLAVSTNGGPAVLFRNGEAKNHGLRLKLVGTKSNRDGIGSVVRVTAGSDAQSQMLRSGSSYLSSSELVLTFGLGSHTQADAIEVRWPSGQVDHLTNVPADQIVSVKEGQGILASKALSKR
jgi:enediyne biosynthesis protein E4